MLNILLKGNCVLWFLSMRTDVINNVWYLQRIHVVLLQLHRWLRVIQILVRFLCTLKQDKISTSIIYYITLFNTFKIFHIFMQYPCYCADILNFTLYLIYVFVNIRVIVLYSSLLKKSRFCFQSILILRYYLNGINLFNIKQMLHELNIWHFLANETSALTFVWE